MSATRELRPLRTPEFRHLVLLAPLAVLAVVAAMLPSLPNADYWSRFAAPYLLAEDRWQGLQAMLWIADNGHRKPLGQLPYLLNFHLFSGSSYGLFAMTAGFAVATAAFLVRALRIVRGHPLAHDVPIVFALVLSPAAMFHWVSPMSGTHWLLADALFAAALWALAHYLAGRRRRYAALACALAMLAAFALTTGLVALALISAALVLAARRKARTSIWLAAVNALFYGGYFLFVFGFAGKTPESLELARWAAFFLSTAGGYFSAKPFGIAPSVLMGIVLIGAWAWMLRRPPASGTVLLIGLFGAYALVNMALIALGRHDLELTVSLTTRYGNIATWLVLAISLGMLEVRPGVAGRGSIWLVALLIGAGYIKGIAELVVYHHPIVTQAPLDRLALMLDLPQTGSAPSYVRFPAAPSLARALRREGHVPFSRFDRSIPLGARAGAGHATSVTPAKRTPVAGGWSRIEFRAPELPDAVDLIDAASGQVIGAAVRLGDRLVGYTRPANAELQALPPTDGI